MTEFQEKLEAFEKALEECAMAEFDTGENFVDEQEKREWDEMKAELHEKEQQAKAALTAHVEALQSWKDALEDQAVVCWVLSESNKDDPRKMLEEVIQWNVQVALDPKVSKTAADWVDTVAAKDAEIERLKADLQVEREINKRGQKEYDDAMDKYIQQKNRAEINLENHIKVRETLERENADLRVAVTDVLVACSTAETAGMNHRPFIDPNIVERLKAAVRRDD